MAVTVNSCERPIFIQGQRIFHYHCKTIPIVIIGALLCNNSTREKNRGLF